MRVKNKMMRENMRKKVKVREVNIGKERGKEE